MACFAGYSLQLRHLALLALLQSTLQRTAMTMTRLMSQQRYLYVYIVAPLVYFEGLVTLALSIAGAP